MKLLYVPCDSTESPAFSEEARLKIGRQLENDQGRFLFLAMLKDGAERHWGVEVIVPDQVNTKRKDSQEPHL